MSGDVRSNLQLDTDIKFLKGVGPARAKRLAKLGLRTVGDLLEHFPMRHERREARLIENLDYGMTATVVGQIARVSATFGRGGKTIRAALIDNTGRCSLTWFHAGWIQDKIKQGMVIRATGKVNEFRHLPQIVNPQFTVLADDAGPVDESEAPELAGVYPATMEVSSKAIAKLVRANLDDMLRAADEPLPRELRVRRELPGRRWALRQMHLPENDDKREKARSRLAYDELLLMQLSVALARRARKHAGAAQAFEINPLIDERIRARFPFALTDAQNRAIADIAGDIANPRPMNRLLQGDVGCGKTVVALYAALRAIAGKAQAAIMAPTELLAEQHYRNARKYLDGSRVRIGFMRGGVSTAERRQLRLGAAAGQLDLIVGTHALIQEGVEFKQLGLVVVDEQHRFGVKQRAALRGKGTAPHFLLMTATPIPRTMALTAFGDLDVTVIDQLPPGRSPIKTRVFMENEAREVWNLVNQRLVAGEQAYVVYPVIEESEKLDLRDATSAFEKMQNGPFADRRVALLHGRLPREERDAVMSAFAAGEIDVLVATTVIEVGIDVPNATCMVIEHSERFGLSQLHQLRGRVGRGDKPGYCYLIGDKQERERLNIMAGTTDGFEIAEEDLRIRGPGEFFGTRQSGLPELRVANLAEDIDLIMRARDDAATLLRNDPHLEKKENRLLKHALKAKYGPAMEWISAG